MFRVGQKVVCVRYIRDPEAPGADLQVGAVYTVGWLGVQSVDGESNGMLFIDPVEAPNPESDEWCRGYDASHFRPVIERKTDISALKALLNPSREKVLADADMRSHCDEVRS